MKLDVINTQGASTGKSIELPDSVFGVEPNEHAVYLAVKQYNAAQRQGTHKAKEKGEITASTRKIKKQKGTGTARAGSLKSGVFRGGGRIFGPRPRNYSFKLNRKVKALARASAFSHKASNGNISVIEDFSFEAPKTKEFKAVVSNLSLGDKKSLFITSEHNPNVYISSRNLQRTEVVSVDEVNTYQIMNANSVVIAEGAVQKLKELYAKKIKIKMASKNILIKPIISEKSEILSANHSQYSFVVNKSANKIEIRNAVLEMYPGINIESVNTITMPAKAKSRNTRAGVLKGRVSSYKKAIVTLAEGDEIDFFGDL